MQGSESHRIARRYWVKHIGRDSMGEVYGGLDRQTGQMVAIKALRPEMAGTHGLTLDWPDWACHRPDGE